MTSSIPAVKAALVSVLAAALPNTQVIYGPSTAVTTTSGRLLTVGKAVGTRQLRSLTRLSCYERYTVELVCSVDLAGTSQQAADELVMADYAAGEAAIRGFAGGSDLGLSASGVLKVLPIGDFELAELADDDGRHAAVRWSVDVHAQTT